MSTPLRCSLALALALATLTAQAQDYPLDAVHLATKDEQVGMLRG